VSAALLCLIVAISDGDTLRVRCGEPGAYQQVTVRISAIDAPEKGQDFGSVSRQHLAALCFQQMGTIAPKSTDRYKRTIADVECRGTDVGSEQIRAGLAWYYVKYGKGYEHLAQVEQQARDAGRGLWSLKAVAPWDWRMR
jgi:endonuclease YncB( thermonuclease family)